MEGDDGNEGQNTGGGYFKGNERCGRRDGKVGVMTWAGHGRDGWTEGRCGDLFHPQPTAHRRPPATSGFEKLW